MEMAQAWVRAGPQLKQAAPVVGLGGSPVVDVDSHCHSLSPEGAWQSGVCQHGAGHPHDHAVEPLSHPIVLGCVWWGGLMNGPLVVEEHLELIPGVLTAVV